MKYIIQSKIKKYELKIDNEIDMGTQGDYNKIKIYEEIIRDLNFILKELKDSDINE